MTDYEYDDLGRITQVLGPMHDVNGETVRTAAWTVYDDVQDEVRAAQGYATGANQGPEYTYTLVNPVSISKLDHAGRTIESISAIRSCGSSGRLSPSDCFPQSSYVRWSTTHYDDHSQVTATRVYHTIPTCAVGYEGTNYDETLYGYDVMGRQNKLRNPAGTISRSVYEVRGLVVSTFLGTNDAYATDSDPTGGGAGGNNLVQITGNVYDDGDDAGDGNLTEATAYLDGSTTRITDFEYDFRNRQTVTEGEESYCVEYVYDNLSHVVQVNRYNATTGGNLIGRSETAFDDRGQVYQTKSYAVDPSSGTVGNALVDNSWYDAVGNKLKTLSAGSETFAKTQYDSLNRPNARYVGYYTQSGSEPYADVGLITANNAIYEQSETEYDNASQAIFVTFRQRWHDATGNGVLNGPTGSQPKSRDSYLATWFDGVGRFTASANYGTNENAGPPERPDSPPESSDLVLVSQTRYNDRGEAFETVDPAGMVNQSETDDAGRTIQTVQNYLVDGAEGSDESDANITTQMQYLAGNMVALTAKNPTTGDQVTRYVFGVTLADSSLASNDLVQAEIPANAADPLDRTTYTYNRQAQTTTKTDRNGTVHQYLYDGLGRQTDDTVTTLASGVDGAVRRIQVSYEIRGLVEKVTSHSAATGGSVVNQVQNAYNTARQLTTQYQEHSGAVNTGTSVKVQYAYDTTASSGVFTKGLRLTTLTYPNSTALAYQYGSGGSGSDKLARVNNLSFSGTNVCQYTYLGLGSFVQVDYGQPDIRYDLATGSSPNPYTGLDRFGRIIDLLWQKYSVTAAALLRLQYGYDRASNRTYRKDLVATTNGKDFDELYGYDQLHRLKKFHRGELVDDNTVIESLKLQQGWELDATGNWSNFKQMDQADTGNTLDQERTHNRVNEITEIARTVGPEWSTPEYDRNGNMTAIPQPADMVSTYRGTWDAWNRLVKVEEPNGSGGWWNRAEYAYDGQNWRVVTKSYNSGSLSETRHGYYTGAWQCIEERLGTTPSSATAKEQRVFGLRYIDDLVLRERDTDGNGTLDERLYVLQDALYSVVAITNTSAAVQERYAYTAYGACQVLEPDFDPLSATAFGWNYRFTGRPTDSGTGLQENRHRCYHALLGSWISEDWIVDDRHNSFRYTTNNALNTADPYGLWSRAGHFWTVYSIAMATGKYTPEEAYRLAYYAQYPDQNPLLDAIAQIGVSTNPNPLYDDYWARLMYFWIHSLHGGDIASVQKRQQCLAKLIRDGGLQPWERGIVIHALGDAFAHVDIDGKAWKWPLGHGVTSGVAWNPDSIRQHDDAYAEYIFLLWRALGGEGSFRKSPHYDAFVKLMNSVPKDSPDKEAAAFEALARALFGYDKEYVPNDKYIKDPLMEADKINSPSAGGLLKKNIYALIRKLEKYCKCDETP